MFSVAQASACSPGACPTASPSVQCAAYKGAHVVRAAPQQQCGSRQKPPAALRNVSLVSGAGAGWVQQSGGEQERRERHKRCLGTEAGGLRMTVSWLPSVTRDGRVAGPSQDAGHRRGVGSIDTCGQQQQCGWQAGKAGRRAGGRRCYTSRSLGARECSQQRAPALQSNLLEFLQVGLGGGIIGGLALHLLGLQHKGTPSDLIDTQQPVQRKSETQQPVQRVQQPQESCTHERGREDGNPHRPLLKQPLLLPQQLCNNSP